MRVGTRPREILLLLVLAFGTLTGSMSGLAADGNERFRDPMALIQEMFPEATRIGAKDPQSAVPAWPIYQVTQVIGFAYESRDLLEFPGFSGEPMNFLIGVDLDGSVRGVEVLYHHEPIFMHGLGPQAFVDFLDQYTGHSIAEHIVVGRNRGSRGNDVTYIDGVTAATVTVVVANDTVLLSAMQVAREHIEAFAQAAPATVRDDLFEAMAWEELLRRKLVQRWSISRASVEASLGSDLAHYDDRELILDNGNEITLHYAYLNPPSVGRNLLGDAGYSLLLEKLAPGEHAFAVFSEGFYSFVPEDFIPASIPDRISLLQNGLPINLRDTNFVDVYGLGLTGSSPVSDNLRIFRARAQAGLDPSEATELQLMVELKKNPLVTDSAVFVAPPYALPAEFFEVSAEAATRAPAPVWVRVWRARIAQIAGLLLALLILAVAFAMQRTLTANPAAFRVFRAGYLAFTLLVLGLYAQGQLSVVNIFAIQLALRDGFSIETFLLDPVIFILWIFVFVSLFLVGRGLFCGWLCPFGALQSFVAWIAERLSIRQWRVSRALHQRLSLLKYVILAVLMGLAMYSLQLAEQAAEVEPFKTAITLRFLREWPFTAYAVLLLGMGLFINKFYCRYLCPLGAGLAVLGRFRVFSLLPRRSECGSPCQLCAVRCETAAIRRDGTIDYNECVQCLDCTVILQDESKCAPARVEQRKRRREELSPIPLLATDAVAASP